MGRRAERVREFLYRNRLRIVVGTLLVAAVVVFFADRIFVVVGAGQAGVRFSPFTGTDHRHIYDEGMHVVYPWDKVTLYNVRLQQREDTLEMLAVNGLQIKIRLSTQFFIPLAKVSELHSQVGPDYITTMVYPEVVSAVRAVIGSYTDEEIYAKGEEGLLEELRTTAMQKLDTLVHYQSLKILELVLPDSVEEAIQSKLVQEQLSQSQGYRVKVAEGQASQKRAEAIGYADFARISGIPALALRQLEAAELISKSPNSKLIVMGPGTNQMPLLLKEPP